MANPVSIAHGGKFVSDENALPTKLVGSLANLIEQIPTRTVLAGTTYIGPLSDWSANNKILANIYVGGSQNATFGIADIVFGSGASGGDFSSVQSLTSIDKVVKIEVNKRFAKPKFYITNALGTDGSYKVYSFDVVG